MKLDYPLAKALIEKNSGALNAIDVVRHNTGTDTVGKLHVILAICHVALGIEEVLELTKY